MQGTKALKIIICRTNAPYGERVSLYLTIIYYDLINEKSNDFT